LWWLTTWCCSCDGWHKADAIADQVEAYQLWFCWYLSSCDFAASGTNAWHINKQW
jgi:hypothetical protein